MRSSREPSLPTHVTQRDHGFPHSQHHRLAKCYVRIDTFTPDNLEGDHPCDASDPCVSDLAAGMEEVGEDLTIGRLVM